MDDNVFNFIKDWLWAPLLGLVAWAWNHNKEAHDEIYRYVDKRNKELQSHIDAEDTKLNTEITRQRDVSAKLFEKVEELRKDTNLALSDHAKRSEERHSEVLGVLREMTNAFHVALSQKADK